MYPKSFLARFTGGTTKGAVFVLMPFAKDFDAVYEMIRDTLERMGQGLQCYRADEIYKPGPIIETILQGIAACDIVIADVTGRNPNVFYELGIAHAIKDNCIIITQTLDDVPFDLRHLRCIVYQNTLSGAQQFPVDLKNAVDTCLTVSRSLAQAPAPGPSVFQQPVTTPAQPADQPAGRWGFVTRWEQDNARGYVNAGADSFYVDTRLLAGAKDPELNDKVYFLPQPPLGSGRNPAAGCVLIRDQQLSGQVTYIPPGKTFGFVKVADQIGNTLSVLMPLGSNPDGIRTGDIVAFVVGENPKGAIALDPRRTGPFDGAAGAEDPEPSPDEDLE